MFESGEHITCREVVETVTHYFDGALPSEDTKGVPLAFLVVAGAFAILVTGAAVIVRRRKAAD